ncbi:hypothetical protein PLESTM_001811900 [Pleodorina starrii]|nr:hypothetical protein PLESTM_001811900 [Pleodorina starrii]
MSQQSQPVVPFNALKPATWGSLKLYPLALRSKLTGAEGIGRCHRVGFGKENAGGQPAGPQAPPNLGDLSHLQALGPRRNVNQRYVLQANLNAPWASSAAAQSGQSSLTTPTSTRPSPQPPERSILASIQLPSSHKPAAPRAPTFGSTSGASLPGHSEGLAPVCGAPRRRWPPQAAASPPYSPVLSAPTIQAALQQALAGAVELKPEAFRVDNFERFFDSLMHPGNAGKLDGPLPDELPDDVRYGDNWYKHCRDWNLRNQPSAPYSAPTTATAACAGLTLTPRRRRPRRPSPVASPMPQTEERDQQQKPQWGLDEPPMSEACCKALDIAHHGLSKVLTPTARSRSVSLDATPVRQRAFAQPSLLERFQQQRHLLQGASTAAVAAELGRSGRQGCVAAAARGWDQRWPTRSRHSPARCETLARDQAVAAEPRRGVLADATTPRADLTDAAEVAARWTMRPWRLVPRITPRARRMGAAARPPAAAADSARPPSTAATTPGHKTPRGGGGGAADSVVTTAANTPVGRAATPTTARAAASATSPMLESAQVAAAATTTTHEPEASAAPLRKLSREARRRGGRCRAPCGGAVNAAAPARDDAARWQQQRAGAVPQRSSSAVTLLHNAPRDMPTPNPAFFSGAPAAGPTSLAAAVAAVAAPAGSGPGLGGGGRAIDLLGARRRLIPQGDRGGH